MVSTSLGVERHGAVAVVTLQRPDQHNALDRDLKCALVTTLRELGADTDVRALVLTGAGRSFCVGQDLGEHAEALSVDPSNAFATVGEHYSPIVTALATMPKPVVAAVNGTCVGAGLGFALAADFRVFSGRASLGTAFSAIALTCDSGLSRSLGRSVGESRARELVLSARTFSVDEAVAWGIAGDVVDPEKVLTTALDLASKLAKGPTAAFAETKVLLAAAAYLPLADALVAEGAAQARCGTSVDHAQAVTAFLDRRRPIFAGR